MSMKRCQLAPDLEISRVVTGLWQVADMEREGRELDLDATAEGVAPYVEAGFTTFDMADHYGSAELIAGRCLERYGRKGVQLFTKWVPKPGPVTRDGVRAAVDLACERMRTSSLDLLQFHAWNYSDPAWLDGLFWLQELRDEGLIRHLGLTNFDAAHLRIALASGIDIVSNQVSFSLLDQRAQGAMTELCREHGVKLLAFGTLAGGFLTERWLGRPRPDLETLETWSQMKYWRFIEAAGGWEVFQNLLATLDGVAQRLDVSLANVACRHVLDEPAVGGIIVGARLGRSEHVRDNLRLFEFDLDERSRTEIDAALSELSPIPGEPGDEYRKPPFLTASGDLSHHFGAVPPPYEARPGADGRTRVLSGTKWEEVAGYCRALRVDERILVSGTTATHGERLIGGRDPAAQLHFVIDKLEGAIQSLGGRLEDVVRTRVYVRDLAHCEALARVHGERFGRIAPANTLVQAGLVGDEHLVEMEAEAVVA
jgi:aryl-alcohol dehydrogenase-like predicted oxidoreductase/enamine deaminase RidA (YjgF/YER057c/UK114 family)